METGARYRIHEVAAGAPGEGALVADLPEALARVEPGGGRGPRREVGARVAPVPGPRAQRPGQRQGGDDGGDVARGGDRRQPGEDVPPGGGVARAGRRQEDRPAAVLERAVGPAVAVPGVVGAVARPVRVVTPGTSWRIASRRDRPALAQADRRAPGWRVGVEPDDGPLFSANAGSSLARQVRGRCRVMCSALRGRRIWPRRIGTPSSFGSSRRRSSVQWQGGGTPRAVAMTRRCWSSA
jgi:hypothetical protein